MRTQLHEYNGIHKGETGYIVGTSPYLNNLTQRDIQFLKGKPSIGVNLAYEGANWISYAISAHIANAVYLFEYCNKEIPIFVDYNNVEKKRAFSYMDNLFWNQDRVVHFSADPKGPLDKFKSETDISLKGDTSILLLATHLAYIMGFQNIVYIGFDETSASHYWDENLELKNKIRKGLSDIVESKKYCNGGSYNPASLWDVHHSVHGEIEWLLGRLPALPNITFGSPEEKANRSFGNHSAMNVALFSQYVKFLNDNGVGTYTLSDTGITLQSGCSKLDSLDL